MSRPTPSGCGAVRKRINIVGQRQDKGKIPKDEWPKIAARFKSGESFTQIARSYQCTAPAIRYIVGRTSTRDGRTKRERAAQGKVASLAPLARTRRSTTDLDDRSQAKGARGNSATTAGKEIWGRINLDIVTFLAAIEALSSDNSDENYRTLLDATDGYGPDAPPPGARLSAA